MNRNDRLSARLIAGLFVLTMLMGMVDAYAAGPILRGPLARIHESSATVVLGGLMRLFMSIGVVGIALAFLPVVRRYNETIALAYLAFRTAEGVLLCLGACGHVFLIGLSRSYAAAGAPEDGLFLALSQGALGLTRATYQMAMTILGVAGTWHGWVLLRARLVPAWIARLGIVGYVLLLASAILDLAGAVDTIEGAGAMLYVPGGLFELVVLPAWLWARGFIPLTPPARATTQAATPAVIAIAAVAASLLGSTSAHAGERWKILDQKDGDSAWVLYSRDRPGSRFVEYRIVGLVDAPPPVAAAAGRKLLVEASYLPAGVRRTILRDDGSTIVSHSRFALPGPFSDREVTLRIDTYRLPSGAMGLTWTSAPELGPPVASGVVRMRESSGSWDFTPSTDGRSLATCVLHGDLGGNIPAWIVNRLAGEALVDDLGRVRHGA
jgi:hypothetical protein